MSLRKFLWNSNYCFSSLLLPKKVTVNGQVPKQHAIKV
jgi:hypothetical protein